MLDDLEFSVSDEELEVAKNHILRPLLASIIFAGFQGGKNIERAVEYADAILAECLK